MPTNASNDTVPLAGDLPTGHGSAKQFARRFSWRLRTILGLSGAVLIALLITAAWLKPDPRQIGTHQQLGLPACSIETYLGVRCPSCGMTTSWAWMMDGRPLRSVLANSGGAMLAVVSLLAGPWMLGSAIRGRWIGGPVNEWIVVSISLAIAVVTMIDWAVRVWIF